MENLENNNNTSHSNESDEFELFTNLTREMLNMIQHLSTECKELKKEVSVLKEKQSVIENFFSMSDYDENYQKNNEKIITLVFVYNKPIVYFSILMKFIEKYENLSSNGLFVNPIHSIETEYNGKEYDNNENDTNPICDIVHYFLQPALHVQIRNKNNTIIQENKKHAVDIISINLKESMVHMLKKISIMIRNDEFSFMNIYDNNGFDITSSFHIVQTEQKNICITF
jgi:hypothetical protein